MLDKPTAAIRIRRELQQSERDLDVALRSQAGLLQTLVTARLDTDASVAQGHASLVRLGKSIDALLSARGNVARVHGEMLELARHEQLGEQMGVDEDGCPENPYRTAELEHVA